jgi:thymidylate synthase
MASPHDAEYRRVLRRALEQGRPKASRCGGGTRSITGAQLRFDLRRGFPLLTCKKVPFRLVAVELQWMLRGETHVDFLRRRGVRIWDGDAARAAERGFDYPEGELGPVYGRQWRAWPAGGEPVDQLARALRLLRDEPTSRRNLVSAWNVTDLGRMVLPPCHYSWQAVCDGEQLDLVVTMRSGDLGLGLPFNIASYALLLSLLARESGRAARELVITIADAHVYRSHAGPLAELLERRAKPAPGLRLPAEVESVEDFARWEDHTAFPQWIEGYESAGPLHLPLET